MDKDKLRGLFNEVLEHLESAQGQVLYDRSTNPDEDEIWLESKIKEYRRKFEEALKGE